MMAAEIEVFLLFKWIGFDTICALDCVYLGLAPTREYTQTKIHNTTYLVCSQHGQKQQNLVSGPF